MKGWTEKLAQGWLPAPPPPGYMTVVTGGKRIHIPDPETRNLMLLVFKRYLEPGESLITVSEYMTELGIRTRTGHPFGKTRMQRILDNPFYVGINRFKGECTQGAQEPIIPKPLFERIQQKLHGGRPQKYRKHHSPLQGLIRCEDCGSLITWQLQKGKYYGVCRRLTEECKKSKMLREDRIEELVMAEMTRLVCPCPEIIDWVTAEIRRQHADNITAREIVKEGLEADIKRLERMDESLYDDKLAGVITKERYEVKHGQFAKEIEEISSRMAELESDMSARLEQRIAILELTQKAAQIYQNKSSEQKRLIISKLFASMTLKSGSLSVTYSKFVEVVAQKVQKTNELIGD